MIKKMSRTTVYMILFCVFLLTVNISLGLVLIRQADEAIRTLIENRMLDVSNTAAAMLDGDALEALEADGVDTPEYQSVLKTLTDFQNNIDLKYIYCIRDLGGGHFVFTIDPSDDPGEFGEPINYTDALYQASLGTPAVDKQPYEDRWGRFYSAYSPVFDSNHRVGGIVAVDFSAEWYENEIASQFRATLLISGISLFFAGAIIILITAKFKKQLQIMLYEMTAVSAGIETLMHEVSPGAKTTPLNKNDNASSNDEVTELRNRIRSLEEQLSEQIAYVRSQAFIDGLTGLGNRAAYEEHVKCLDDEIKAGTAQFSIALFDLNGLKELNDRYGHEKGDQAILELTAVLKQEFEDAKLYRIGGDEFIAVFTSPLADISPRFQRIDRALGEKDGVSAAKGYAAFEPGSDMGYRVVFNRADYAMYNDKKNYYMTHTDRRKR